MKKCSKCLCVFPLSSFHANTRAKDGLASYCKQCAKDAVLAWTRANPEKRAANRKKYEDSHRESLKAKRSARARTERTLCSTKKAARKHRLKARGLTPESFVQKLRDQQAMCAICGKDIDEKSAVTDHCHTTGRTRDLLCPGCNLSLGHIERPSFLAKALAYIERHRSNA